MQIRFFKPQFTNYFLESPKYIILYNDIVLQEYSLLWVKFLIL